ncbi:MAG: hypothetical protein ACRERW_08000 [Pseudomonas sp.]
MLMLHIHPGNTRQRTPRALTAHLPSTPSALLASSARLEATLRVA